jgi:hypothetical protein
VRSLGLGFLFTVGVLVHPIRADQGALPAPPIERPRFEKGTVEISILGGLSLPIDLFRSDPKRHLVLASVSIGRVMAGGPGRGSFEWLVDASPFVLVRQPDSVRGWSVAPLFLRWNFPPLGGRARLFAEVSGSLLFTEAPVPVRTTTFNFLDQGGFGIRVHETARHAWLAGYRFQHVSNGGRVRPNPGANFHLVYGGVSFLR